MSTNAKMIHKMQWVLLSLGVATISLNFDGPTQRVLQIAAVTLFVHGLIWSTFPARTENA